MALSSRVDLNRSLTDDIADFYTQFFPAIGVGAL